MKIPSNSSNTLAVGIPTYKRPEFAMKLIQRVIEMDIYDEIIVSSNSKEIHLNNYIKSLQNKNLIYFQQDMNVGLAMNYFKIIELCNCAYLHIISDEDMPNYEHSKKLYQTLIKEKPSSLIVASVNDKNGNIYKDASWQRNNHLIDLLGETAHIGSSIINLSNIGKHEKKLLHEYCNREGSVYVGPAAALLAYSNGETIRYFPESIVEMGELHENREISGEFIYGVRARLLQFLNLYSLLKEVKFKKKYKVTLRGLYYFSHHALQDAVKKYQEKPYKEFNKIKKETKLPLKTRIAIHTFLISFYFFYIYFKSRTILSKLIKRKKD